jgi:spore coat protein U-like protein
MLKRNIFSLLGVAALMSSAALALTATANITPSATVTATCLITGNPLAFGAYDPFAGAPVFQSTTISVQCTNGMPPPPITMDQGQNPAGGSSLSTPLRQMSNGTGGLLSYNLYSDASSTIVWEGTIGVISPAPTGSPINMNVFGKVNGGQPTVPAGTYNDLVIVTVTF